MKLSFPALFAAARPRAARRALLVAAGLLAAALALPAPSVHAQAWRMEHWVGTWGAGPGGPPLKLLIISGNSILRFPVTYCSPNKSKE